MIDDNTLLTASAIILGGAFILFGLFLKELKVDSKASKERKNSIIVTRLLFLLGMSFLLLSMMFGVIFLATPLTIMNIFLIISLIAFFIAMVVFIVILDIDRNKAENN